MPEKTFTCSVITPDAQVYDGRVESVVIPAHDGQIGVLFNRAPLVCKLGAGSMRLTRSGREETWFIDGGFAQVLENRIIVLTQKAIPQDQIDRSQAMEQLTAAQSMKVTDEISARNKARAEASARAQLRMTK